LAVAASLDVAPVVKNTADVYELDSRAFDMDCECMVCDLPLHRRHEPVEWRVTLNFPGPYPMRGIEVMLLCDHCKGEWVDGNWAPPYDNFSVVRCVKV
jgi:hypothetical protein